MRYNTLGLLETYGYIPAIVALDTALKTANVTLKDLQITGGGLVTIMVEGDVAAVQAAIEAGGTAAETVGYVVSQHVIPRSDLQLKLFFEADEDNGQQTIEESPSSNLAEAADKVEEIEEAQEILEVPKDQKELVQSKTKALVIEHNGKEIRITSKKDLHRMKVVELRKIARGLAGFSMETKKIKFANKSELVQAILNYTKMEVE
ncbi:Carboxysome shell and ethanolamine utilization microcompartment protein CcmL/EutN [Anaerovirgula multivorans]|uniref:Carboxysome shell and ethanolamine utilization microcompartment protein CcmL/EutN n=1 Tax=Anaerovirgula multivorans TaxID=312168 RepID=A0A239BY12_9FIRM|nr:BMC domain-containing protein [Anaerovirgula multivorans]SNS12542.1 Carboxysome shell and ethanolamine utilization microcompartment protein CcmL/EutN [Anaerovirgula multivorans]